MTPPKGTRQGICRLKQAKKRLSKEFPIAKRNYLFLQGMATQFFSRLGHALAERGHGVRRVNFNGGDRLFWGQPGAEDFRQDAAAWPDFLIQRFRAWQTTDIILFGDCRPLHREAVKLAAQRGIAVHVFEEGYLRPNWVTLESGGVNGHSSLPRDPASIREVAMTTPPWDGGAPVPSDFFRRAVEDVMYNVATAFFAPHYPGYRTHRPWHPFVEYAAGARRFVRKPAIRRHAAAALQEILNGAPAYYLFPLQLDSDSQIRYHSPLGRMSPVIHQVIDSFARHAPAGTRLVITEHPLDNGVVDQKPVALERAAARGIAARVVYLEGGSPSELVEKSLGMVTVNSTLGPLAMALGVPVKALGHAIYAMADLSFQGALDDFWNERTPPDRTTFEAFRRVVAAHTQVNGGFFSAEGVARAVEGAVVRLEASPAPAEIGSRQNLPGARTGRRKTYSPSEVVTSAK